MNKVFGDITVVIHPTETTPEDRVVAFTGIGTREDFDIETARRIANEILVACNFAEKQLGLTADKEAPEALPAVCYEVMEHITVQRRIVAAASRYGEFIIPSARHGSPDREALIEAIESHGVTVPPPQSGDDDGFIDQFGNYHTREIAYIIARNAGQVNRDRPNSHDNGFLLFSENLY